MGSWRPGSNRHITKGQRKEGVCWSGWGLLLAPESPGIGLIPCFSALHYSWPRAPWQEVAEKKAVATSAGKGTKAAVG